MRAAIEQAAQPQIWLNQPGVLDEHAGDDLPVGTSRLGGDPDLPGHVEWPTRDGKHLPFLAQFDLSILPQWEGSPLPRTGWFWAFAAGGFPMESALIHWAGDRGQLSRREPPGEEEMILGDRVCEPRYDVVPLERPAVVFNLPRNGDEYWVLEKATGGDPKLREGLSNLFDELLDEDARNDDLAARFLGRISIGADESPSVIAVEYGRRAGGDDWISLFEITSAGSMQWSDAGTLGFLIRASELARDDFSNTYAIVSSS